MRQGAAMTGMGDGSTSLPLLVARIAVLIALAVIRGAERWIVSDLLAALERTVWEIVSRRADRMDPYHACLSGDSRSARRACAGAVVLPDGADAVRRRLARLRAVFGALDACAARLAAYRRRLRALAALPPGCGERVAAVIAAAALLPAPMPAAPVPAAPDTS